MRLVSIYDIEEGVALAKPIYDHNNRVLLNENVTLRSSIIRSLINKGVTHIYVKSPITEGVKLKDDIPVSVRVETTQQMTKVFKSFAEGKANKKFDAVSRGKSIKELKDVYDRLLKEMRSSPKLINLLTHLQTGDSGLFEHSLNVSIYAVTMARCLAVKESDIYTLGLGGMFHDIGKSKLDKDLLMKKDRTEEEEKEWQNHTVYGFDMLRNERDLHLLVSHCAYQHHENIDGSGFPRGLKGPDIHLFAKIIAVADLFDTLTHPGIGRKALLPHEAMEVIMGQCYTRFDPKILDAFRKSVAIYPVGVTVTLNSGAKGVVVDYNIGFPQRPKIRVFTDNEGNRLDNFYELDLMDELNVMIVECDAILDEGRRANSPHVAG